MYQLGVRPHHRRNLYLISLTAAVAIIIGGTIWAQHYFQPDTSLQQSHRITRHVDAQAPATKIITTTYFTMTIPKVWQTASSNLIPAATYAWHGTGQEASARRLDVYVDDIPSTMAVNRLLPLGADGDRLILSNDVSDNCVNFTDDSQADQRTGTILAKWSGVTFNCDSANYERNLVGTGTPGAINSVSLHGPVTGGHRFFFIYTDHSGNPDYSIFTDMLRSFRAR